MMDIKEQLIELCCRMFSKKIMSEEPDEFYGTPPRLLYIEFGMPMEDKRDFQVESIVEQYEFSKDGLKQIPADQRINMKPVSGMYWRVAKATIGYTEEKAYLNMVVGPRFARGFEMEIVKENGQDTLGEMKLLWVS